MSIEELREEIDKIDDKIINLLKKRKNTVKKISDVKKQLNKQVIDEEREQQVIERIKERAKAFGLDEKFVTSLYGIILRNSRAEQKK